MDNHNEPVVVQSSDTPERRIIKTAHYGEITVYIQGHLQHAGNKAVFLTVHDMGSNHEEFCKFVDHPSMLEVRRASVFVHVDLPGQEDHAPDLPDDFVFPDMKTMGHVVAELLDALQLDYVIGLGEGAGANILARFGMDHPTRCLGLILIHCTSTAAGVMEYFRDKLINWKLSNVGMNPTAEQYLVFHKFGRSLEEQLERSENKERVIQDYQKKLRRNINPKNLRRYVETFLNRTDLSEVLEAQLKTDVMLVAGTLASHLHTVRTMAAHLNKTKSTLVLIDGVGDVLNEAPEKFAHNLVLYVQGLGKLSSLGLGGSANQHHHHHGRVSLPQPAGGLQAPADGGEFEIGAPRSRAMSMEDYDVPNVRRLSSGAKKD